MGSDVSAGAGDRVLVVEDDATVRELVCDMLGAAAIPSVCVGSDREAHAVLATVQAFAGLIVDVNLGAGTTGFDVARFARKLMPDLPVIYITGQSTEQSFRAFGVPDSHFMPKPFSAEQLVAKVRELMRPAA